jgi:hypothetical protein
MIDGVHARDLARPAEHVTVDPAVQGGHPVNRRDPPVPFEAVATLIHLITDQIPRVEPDSDHCNYAPFHWAFTRT